MTDGLILQVTIYINKQSICFVFLVIIILRCRNVFLFS